LPEVRTSRTPHPAAHSTCLRVAALVEAIANGSAPAELTVTSLTSALPHSWTKQEKKFGVV
jgi:hypothetical protein